MPASPFDQGKDRFGVEPIWWVLTAHGIKIAPSTFYDAAARGVSARAARDEDLKPKTRQVFECNYGVYGARKVWLALNRDGVTIARCTVERLMREMGLHGVHRGKARRTTIADPQGIRARDLVLRQFNPPAPNRLWVADMTYVLTWSGFVYAAFVIDAYSRPIVSWRTATTMTSALVLVR